MNRLIVLDTNVIVSAGISNNGPTMRIIDEIIAGKMIFVTCPAIVEEYWDVVRRPKFRRLGLPPIWLEGLMSMSHYLREDPPKWHTDGPDPDDLIFLSLANEMNAVLITGNIKHYPLEIRENVIVLTPADYVNRFS